MKDDNIAEGWTESPTTSQETETEDMRFHDNNDRGNNDGANSNHIFAQPLNNRSERAYRGSTRAESQRRNNSVRGSKRAKTIKIKITIKFK